MLVAIRELLEKPLKPGEIVEIKAIISELIPVFSFGNKRYERMIISDNTGKITVLLPSSPKYFLPGDTVRLKGRLRPCPYMPSEKCIETNAEDVEILEPKWIRPQDRMNLDDLGPFTLFSFLAVTTLDEEMMGPILKTRLEPTKIYEEVRKRVERGENPGKFIELIEAMALYSVFFRSLKAAEVAQNSVIMVKGLNIGMEHKARLELVEKFLRTLVDIEGFRPYITGPIKGLVETYPIASVEELEGLGKLGEIGIEVAKSLRGEGDLKFVIVQLGGVSEGIEKVRKVIEMAAGVGGASLLSSTIDATLQNFEEVMEKMEEVPNRKERTLLYIEGLEILAPSNLFISTYVKSPDIALRVRMKSINLLSRILKNPNVVLVGLTPSVALVAKEVVEKADKVLGEEKKVKKGGEYLPYTV